MPGKPSRVWLCEAVKYLLMMGAKCQNSHFRTACTLIQYPIWHHRSAAGITRQKSSEILFSAIFRI